MNREKLAVITIILALTFAVGVMTMGTLEEAKGAIGQSQSSNQNSQRQYIQSIQNQGNTDNNAGQQ
jgi:hypothetical protein